MKQFHSLPTPRDVGLEWPEFEQAVERLERVEERHREAGQKARELQERIRQEQSADVRALAESILRGNDDPAAPVGELEGLAAELREQRRLREALEQALPQAEEALRRTVHEHRDRWIAEADAATSEALQAEREAFGKALQMADKARARRLVLETLASWCRTTPPSFGPPADVSVRSAFEQLSADIDRAEHRLHERAANERLEAEENARRERETEVGAV